MDKARWTSLKPFGSPALSIVLIVVGAAVLGFGLLHRSPKEVSSITQPPSASAQQESPTTPSIPKDHPKTALHRRASKAVVPTEPKPPATAQQQVAPAQPTFSIQENKGNVAGINNGSQTVINNPPSPEKTWQLTPGQCYRWLPSLKALNLQEVDFEFSMSDDDAARIADNVGACFRAAEVAHISRSVQPPRYLPEGVTLGARENGKTLDAIAQMLNDFGLQVSKRRDIRSAYGETVEIMFGSNVVVDK